MLGRLLCRLGFHRWRYTGGLGPYRVRCWRCGRAGVRDFARDVPFR